MQTVLVHVASHILQVGDREITCVADSTSERQFNTICNTMRTKLSAVLDLAILEESSGKDEDGKNADKDNTILAEMKNGRRRTNKGESSEESAEEQDDVMDQEEEEMAMRLRRNSCIHGARRKSLDGL